MTAGEDDVRRALDVALRAFDRLPVQCDGDRAAFRAAVGQALGVVAVRAPRRLYPGGWPTYEDRLGTAGDPSEPGLRRAA